MSEVIGATYNQDTIINEELFNSGGMYNILTYPDGSMTNEKLNNIIQLYHSNIFVFVFNGNKRLFLGYKSSPKMENVSLITVGSTDFIKVANKKRNNQKEIEYFTLFITSHLQSIGMMNDGYIKYGPDPLLFF